ncbi:MAG TPA: DUF3881 family protein [Candidatus Merdenecus merdavium]|nr:DUF3881 family protein [Candidatus Merdenecus merdavium]
MHNYLRAIGFSKIRNKKELEAILKETITKYDEKNMVYSHEGANFAEISKSFLFDGGITVCGEYDEEDNFVPEYYFPFFRGTGVSTTEDVIVERHAGKESYAGACDDIRVGVTMIFYLQNAAEYKKQLFKEDLPKQNTSVTFSALSTDGKILLPIAKNKDYKKETKKALEIRNNLISAARKGDEEAMESLTIEDIDTYSMISRRIATEDVFTIVDTYFMPYGMECDHYNVMGEIIDYNLVKNTYTNEKIYQLYLECNDVFFDVCINEEDLMGKPEVGRRFKGNIWLQGYINFEK